MIEQSTYCSLATSGWDDRSKKMCCYASLPKYKNFSTMHKDQLVQNLIQDLSTGTKNPICNTCWQLEKNGIKSMRQQSLQNEGLPKTQEFIEKEFKQIKLKYIIVDSGTQCNFACRTCGPYASTGHTKEWEEKNQKKWIWITQPTNLDNLSKEDLGFVKNIEVLGGEPFINLEHLKILDKIKNNSPYWLTYTTNGSVKLQKEIYNKFSYFKAVNICLSIDAVGKPFNYIRTLGNWDKVKNNIDSLLDLKKEFKHLSVNCHITVSALNILYLDTLIDYLNDKKINFDFTFCKNPAEYDLIIFSANEISRISEILKNVQGCEPVLSYVKQLKYDQNARNDFFKAVDFTLKYRNLDYKEYLPKLSELIIGS